MILYIYPNLAGYCHTTSGAESLYRLIPIIFHTFSDHGSTGFVQDNCDLASRHKFGSLNIAHCLCLLP